MINKVIFNFQTNTMKVEFTSGALYEYTNVDPAIYDELCKADSQGQFFNEKIKNNYEFNQLLID
tara:strand:+ start:700 stop:891 length:192 start_codon:yes stop_codon:yes gene_type:complete